MEIVDQYYWLAYAKKTIDDANNRLNDAAAKISTLVAVFWGIYTSAFTTGVIIKKFEEPYYILFLFVLPIPLLIFSYIFALYTQMPDLSLKGIDPRAPEDVMNYYTRSTHVRKRRLISALILLFVSGLSLSLALISANFTHDKFDKRNIISIRPSAKSLIISGDLPNGTVVIYQLTRGKEIVLRDSTVVTSDNHFDKTLPRPETNYKVTVTWTDAGDKFSEHTFSKTIESSAGGKKDTK